MDNQRQSKNVKTKIVEFWETHNEIGMEMEKLEQDEHNNNRDNNNNNNNNNNIKDEDEQMTVDMIKLQQRTDIL